MTSPDHDAKNSANRSATSIEQRRDDRVRNVALQPHHRVSDVGQDPIVRAVDDAPRHGERW